MPRRKVIAMIGGGTILAAGAAAGGFVVTRSPDKALAAKRYRSIRKCPNITRRFTRCCAPPARRFKCCGGWAMVPKPPRDRPVLYQNARTLTHAAIRRVGFHPTVPPGKVKGMMG